MPQTRLWPIYLVSPTIITVNSAARINIRLSAKTQRCKQNYPSDLALRTDNFKEKQSSGGTRPRHTRRRMRYCATVPLRAARPAVFVCIARQVEMEPLCRRRCLSLPVPTPWDENPLWGSRWETMVACAGAVNPSFHSAQSTQKKDVSSEINAGGFPYPPFLFSPFFSSH